MISKIINRLFPTKCVGCACGGEYICFGCRGKLIPHQEICNVCHKYSKDFVTHAFCKEKVYFDQMIILREFTSIVKKLIYSLKFFHKFHSVDFLADKLWLGLQSHGLDFVNGSQNISNIYISFVPSHWIRKYWVKGYNQSELLARRLSEISDIKLLNISKKIKYTQSQVNLDRAHRLINLSGAYEISDKLGKDFDGNIYIVDDISTTGSTINEIAKSIKQKYPKVRISGLVIARSNK